jgi:hypothetical protein
MKSRLPARKERAKVARRLAQKFGEISHESAAAERKAENGVLRVISRGLLIFGATAGVDWWQGAPFTLGHLIALVLGAAGLAAELWMLFRRSEPEQVR